MGSAAATRLELSRARGGLNETSASGGVREPALLAYIIYRKKKEKKRVRGACVVNEAIQKGCLCVLEPLGVPERCVGGVK